MKMVSCGAVLYRCQARVNVVSNLQSVTLHTSHGEIKVRRAYSCTKLRIAMTVPDMTWSC